MRVLNRISVAMMAAAMLAGCSAEKTQEGEMPDVDVNAEGGQLPKYDVDPAKVEITSDTQQVVTPQVEVTPAPDNDGK